MDEYIELEAVCREFSTDDTLSGYEKAYCREIIKKIPAADVAPVRHGRWILDCFVTQSFEGEYDEDFYLICSECGRKVYDINQSLALKGDANLFNEQFPYCHCGAKMDGKKEKLEKLLHANFREPDVNVRIEYEDSNTERG